MLVMAAIIAHRELKELGLCRGEASPAS